jgi:hypothetical protein
MLDLYNSIIHDVLLKVYENGEKGVIACCNCDVPSKIILWQYKRLNLSIEDLPKEQKQELWEFASINFINKTKEQKLNICKILHTIGTLL